MVTLMENYKFLIICHVSKLFSVFSVGKTTIFLTDLEQWTLETMNWPGTMKHCMWNLTGYYLLDWSSLKLIWENPPLRSSLAFSITGYNRQFQMCPSRLLQTSLNAAIPWAPGEAVWHTEQQLLWFLGSFSEGFIWSLSVAALQGNGDMWLSPLCPSHMIRRFTCHGATPCGEQVLFLLPQLLTIYSSILLLCIHFLSCPSCHICTVTSWFPIFNCPQWASSSATPAFVGTLICHCPNWSSKHLKFSLYERVVFLQVHD